MVPDLWENGHVISTPESKAEVLNKQFSSVFLHGRDVPPPALSSYPITTAMPDIEVTECMVNKKLASTNVNKTEGLDNIHPWLLKYTKDILATPLALIQHQSVKYESYHLSPLSKHRLGLVKKKILILDLDETLIHSHHDGVMRQIVKPGTPPDFVLRVTIDRHPVRFFVHKRPHVDFFLDTVAQWYELVVFTASMEIYGAAVADKLDNNRGVLRRRYYRQHCTQDFGSYTKDLSLIHPDLTSVFIIDNSPGAYRAYPSKYMNSLL
ncbi:hypothetical protein QYM36_013264 [Artemia franciscana]|uniref:FCP1 homology domain-containing protein n=1 Tax=Artemia franciscana TaxID=6661 RepID=A0AA88HKY1_ARTSF|nr:hypothetical protein QYM36_013264 [Artemia franciscana]